MVLLTPCVTAVKLAEGELLEGIAVKEAAFIEWLTAERTRIGKLVCDALLKLGESELSEGSSGAALERAQAIIARDEYNESGHRLAMRAYVALGRRTDALRHYQEFSDLLGAKPWCGTGTLKRQSLRLICETAQNRSMPSQ